MQDYNIADSQKLTANKMAAISLLEDFA